MMKFANFRGIRFRPRPNEWTDDNDAELRRGVAMLDKYNLTMDYWEHDYTLLPKFIRLAKAFPNVTMILDHLGGYVGPGMTNKEFEDWKKNMSILGKECPNVNLKVGGIQMEENEFGFQLRKTPIDSEELAQVTMKYYGHAIDCFGPSRCMFESNFPVDKSCVSYRTLWNAFKRIANMKNMTPSDKDAIFHDTACRVYKLNDETSKM